MKTAMCESHQHHLGLWACGILVSLSCAAGAAQTWSLADDFSLSVNTTTSTWSYGLATADGSPDPTSNLFATNTRNANELWNTTFTVPPTMWSDADGYWGIGRNDTGVIQTSDPISWAPGEILIHPKYTLGGAEFPGRLVISWLAPSDTTVGIDYSWADAMPGDWTGVGLRIWHNGTVLTDIGGDGWLDPSSAGSGTISNLSVAAGDRVFFEYDTWEDPTGDVTRTAILITAVPEPRAALLGGLGLLALLRRRRN